MRGQANDDGGAEDALDIDEGGRGLQTIVGVRFKKAGKIYYFSPGRHEIAHGDEVIVETVRGMECGRVVLGAPARSP